MKYRKKPVTIEAYQTDVELDIPTLEGTMHASVGDYIITGVRGEQYPCKPDIFLETYEPAEGGDDGTLGRGTCHEVKIDRYWRGCGECGYIWEHMYAIGKCTRPNFCPNCGAKVVDE